MVIGCLTDWELLFDAGNSSFSTLGVASVEVMRKNRRRKNMMSFSEAE
jgi:hypothetical protein